MLQKKLSTLRGLYKKNPELYSLIELFILLGLYCVTMWVATFWYWGIYRFNIHIPGILDRILLYVWHLSPHLVLPSIMVGLFLIVLTSFVRKDSLKELGIRFDNIKPSGKECIIVSLIGANLLFAFFFIHHEGFTPNSFQRLFFRILDYALAGTGQQFLLQSIIFVRLNQIFKNKRGAILTAAVIFSLLHVPNIPLMVVTLIAGLVCCILFVRHRNIFTLGITHGVMAVMVYSLFVPAVIENFRTGPWKNNTEFVACLKYEGDNISAKTSDDTITIPIEIENKSTIIWNSKNQKVFITYHLLDKEGTMITFDNFRTSLPHPISPGESLTVNLVVTVPTNPGHYQLEIDMLKDWESFTDNGLLPIYIPLVVLPYSKTHWDFTG